DISVGGLEDIVIPTLSSTSSSSKAKTQKSKRKRFVGNLGTSGVMNGTHVNGVEGAGTNGEGKAKKGMRQLYPWEVSFFLERFAEKVRKRQGGGGGGGGGSSGSGGV
ncbi:hypothetical protein HDV00_006571, partial [Rhizophlyctis rosea]